MSPREARELLAAELRVALGDEYAVYHAPPDGPVVAPALVIGPRTPYIEQSAYCSWDVSLRLTLAMPRAAGVLALDQLDDLVQVILPTILASETNAVIDNVGDIGPVQEAGGVEYITAAIDITAHI